MRRILLLALLLALPHVTAGTASSPEITDGTSDVDAGTLGQVSVARPEIDLVAVWLDATPATVTVHWSLADLAHRTPLTGGAVYDLTYRDEASRFGVVDAAREGEAWRFTWFAVAPDGTGHASVLTGRVLGNEVQADVPRALFQGTLTDLRAGALLLVEDPRGGLGGGGNAWLRDAAPDAGYGRDYSPD